MPSVSLWLECFIGLEHNTDKQYALALSTAYVMGGGERALHTTSQLKTNISEGPAGVSQKNLQGLKPTL